MADLDPSPTLDEVKEKFLGTIQVPRTAETYRWALGAFVRFVGEKKLKQLALSNILR